MSQIKKRSEIEEKYKWNLEAIYPDNQAWETEYKEVQSLAADIEGKKGSLGNSAADLLAVLKSSDELETKAEKIYVYAKMRRDEDNANNNYQILYDRAENLIIRVNSASSFIVPEISNIPEDKLRDFLAENQDLSVYQHFFDEILRQKKHILSVAEEKILANVADLSYAPTNIFSMINNADIKFPIIKDEKGNDVELTKGRYGRFMESEDRRVRRDAYKALYSSYGKLKNTIGTTLSSSVKKDIFYARTRKYNSAIEAALDQDNVAVEVYDRLIDTVHKNLDYMYRYIDLRKKLLGLDKLQMYDIYVPLIKNIDVEITYEEAKDLVVKGLEPLGADYLKILQEGLNSGWIDVYENEGKTSGAYSWGSYATSPYILLNYDNKLNDVFTLAHELGHSLHTYYSNSSQPYVYSQYSIFVAEVASTVNESLLIDYMINKAKNDQEKMYLINHYLEQFRGTVYRQTMFAEFEKIIHEKVENGEALTPEILSEVYQGLNELYYGAGIELDEKIASEWMRIPHFYSAFYVYKYATGFSAATALKEQIIKEGEPAVNRYIDFLKSGSSDYPLNVLKKAGVDLTKAEPVQDALDYFGRLVGKLEELV
ncbi:MAG TPA: oligoendopeptidase F [Syntrophomonadaceae bacterium]|nr:oligoendopeptidase F [Syntrophomonadaceae bacterium]